MFEESQLIAIVAAILTVGTQNTIDAKTSVMRARILLTESQNQYREALKPRK